ncbi:MAG: Crp/Fnr family transcriptional regulator [Filomicrobium sp.]
MKTRKSSPTNGFESAPVGAAEAFTNGPVASDTGSEQALEEVLATYGVAVKARRRQRLPVDFKNPDTLYFVKSGLLILNSVCAGERQQPLSIFYPGDFFMVDLVPPFASADLIAMTEADLVRIRQSSVANSPEDLRMLDKAVGKQTADMFARSNLHIARLSALSSESRVAAFILELGLRTGQVVNDTVTCDLPLSRNDIADYLSLNADTLSRIMTRLKARGVVATIGRSRAIVKSIKKLCRESPICNATMVLHGGTLPQE